MYHRRGEYKDGICTVKCTGCGKEFKIPMTQHQWDALGKGYGHIQDILPMGEYTPEQRELFMTGWCDECFP